MRRGLPVIKLVRSIFQPTPENFLAKVMVQCDLSTASQPDLLHLFGWIYVFPLLSGYPYSAVLTAAGRLPIEVFEAVLDLIFRKT
jgi:hypothetical protein